MADKLCPEPLWWATFQAVARLVTTPKAMYPWMHDKKFRRMSTCEMGMMMWPWLICRKCFWIIMGPEVVKIRLQFFATQLWFLLWHHSPSMINWTALDCQSLDHPSMLLPQTTASFRDAMQVHVVFWVDLTSPRLIFQKVWGSQVTSREMAICPFQGTSKGLGCREFAIPAELGFALGRCSNWILCWNHAQIV